MLKVKDRVKVKDLNGKWWVGTIININPYREPSQIYCVDLDDYNKDYVFVGEDEIKKLTTEILAKDFSVSKNEQLHWNDALVYGKERIIKDLMFEFYNKYLSSEDEYKCKIVEEHTSEAKSGIEKVSVYLYIEKVEE